MSIERQAAAGLKWAALSKTFAQAANWAITLIVVRLLLPEEYGLMAMSLAIIAVVAIASDLGLGASLVRVAQVDRSTLARMHGLVILLNLGAGLLLVALAPVAAWLLREPRLTFVIQVLALQFGFAALSSVPQAIATRNMQFKRLAWIEMCAGLATGLCTLALAWLGAGIWALVGGYVLGAALNALLLCLGSYWVWPIFRFSGVKEHLRFGGAITASRMAWQFTSQLDVLIGGRVLGREAMGVYSVAVVIASLPMQKIMSIVNQIAFPTVARIQSDRARLQRHLVDALRLISFLGVPAAWGIATIAPEFVSLVLTDRWSAATLPIQILCLIIPFRMLGSLLVTAAVASGSGASEFRSALAAIIVLPPAFLVGVHWGATGLAWAWVIGIVVIYGFLMPRVAELLGIPLRDIGRAIFPSVLAGAAMLVVVVITRSLTLHLNLAAQLALLIGAGAVTYLLVVSALDRSIWRDLGRVASVMRG